MLQERSENVFPTKAYVSKIYCAIHVWRELPESFSNAYRRLLEKNGVKISPFEGDNFFHFAFALLFANRFSWNKKEMKEEVMGYPGRYSKLYFYLRVHVQNYSKICLHFYIFLYNMVKSYPIAMKQSASCWSWNAL